MTCCTELEPMHLSSETWSLIDASMAASDVEYDDVCLDLFDLREGEESEVSYE